MEPLSEGVNLVIGANGHGKSNFLDAIIFVLTDKYSNLRQEDKKLLVHEEPGEEITQISVELILDNKSRRFPVDKDTVNISKIYHVNENREEILINQKKLLRSDINNLLESAGFCKQNPYYIIQQGKINTIINMNEFELFEIFSEVTGTKIYEEKKSESMKLLDEARDNKNKIIKQRDEINDYILRLETQCEDLASFEKLEAKKKACEFFVFNEKVADHQINIDLLEERRGTAASTLQSLSANLNLIKEKINEKLQIQNKLNKHMENLRLKIKRCDNEISNIHAYTYKEEAGLKILNEKNKTNSEMRQQLEAELKLLKSEQSKLNMEHLRVSQKVRDLDKEIETNQAQFNELKGKLDIILLKQSGNRGLMSENERKNFVQNEIKKLSSFKEEINSKILNQNNSIKQDEEKFKSLTREVETIDQEINESSLSIKKINDSLIEYKKRRINIVNNSKKIDLSIHEGDEENESIKESQKTFEKLIPNFETVQAIRNIKKENIPGVYGCLLDLITVDKKYKNTLDIFAKDKLYSLIVDNLDTANKILEFNKLHNGPVLTILPLEWNRENKPINYPSSSDAVPFIQFIEIKEEFLKEYSQSQGQSQNNLKNQLTPIIQKLFGKCLLVKNYEVGMKFAKQFDMTCITAENEVVYAGAFVTKVGYYDYRRNRATLYDQINENFSKIKLIQTSKTDLEAQKQILSNEETKILRECQSCALRKTELSNKLQELTNRHQSVNEEMMSIREIINSKKNIIDKLIQDKTNTEQKIINYENILLSKNFSISTQDEVEEMSILGKEKNQVEKKLIELEKARNYILQQKMNIESRINDYLNKKELELNSKLNEINSINMGMVNSSSSSQQGFDFTEERAVINDIENNLKDIENLERAKLKYIEESHRLEKESEVILNEVNLFKSEMNKINERMNKSEAELKSVLLSLTDSTEKKNLLLKNIASLGQIKSEEVEKFSKLKEQQMKLISNESGIDVRDTQSKLNKILDPIYAKLEKINRKMKKFEKINRFALEDYKLFKSKREEVNEKLEDLQSKEDELFDVIRVLDEKKENAIQTTFEKVSRSFEYFFKELVPSGFANLSLENVNSGLTQNKNSNSMTQNRNGSSLLSKAIYINVSFSGHQNSIQSMHQLSGGQKTAVAVALIFALSKIDPPPFYILDEIDAALDPTMRSNLAKLISHLSHTNQYVISTFKPEILDVSDNIYQVRFLNKTSNLNKISKEEASKFIIDINI
jgi:structural maintenance of chromosome 3 (chondroitin sulfate proteoglycan 6)